MKFLSRIRNIIARLAGRLTPCRRRRIARSGPPAGLVPGYRVVSGGAATGKSSMMEAEARAAMDIPGLRMIVITTSERTARRLTALPSFSPERHFIGSARALCCRLIPPGQLSPAEELIAPALDCLDSGRSSFLPAAMVLIDDAQNLSPAMIRLVDRLTDSSIHSTTYFLDPAHGIFGFAGAGPETLSLIRSRAGRRIIRLSSRRRPVAPGAARLTAPDARAAVTLAADRAASLIGPGITVALLTRTNAEARDAAIILSTRGIPHLLLTSRLIAADSPAAAIGAEPWRHYALRQSDLHELMTGGVTIATVHTARDREASHVVILDTLPHPSDAARRAEDTRRISLAISRGCLSATVITIED